MTGIVNFAAIPIDLRVKFSFVQNFAAIPIGLRAKCSFVRLWVLFGVSFIELAQNLIAIHCDGHTLVAHGLMILTFW